MKNSKFLFLILTLILSSILLSPYLSFLNLLSTGDHGRDFYAFKETLYGKKPYLDYWWVYGPLMPYYYACFYKCLGMQMTSILLGKIVIQLVGCAAFYLGAHTFMPPVVACLTTLWFVSFMQDFFFTFNHAGGTTALLGVLWCVFSYQHKPLNRYLWLGAFLAFILGLIKINFGIATCVSMALSILIIARANAVHSFRLIRFYLTILVAVPALIIFVHWLYLHPLPFYAIRQCMPYANVDQPYNTSPFQAIALFLTHTFQNMQSNPVNLAFGILINLSAIQTGILFFRKNQSADFKKSILLTVAILSIFYLSSFHEFLKSGVWYRGFWAQPFSILLSFFLIHTATAGLSKVIRIGLGGVLATIILINFTNTVERINYLKRPEHFLFANRGGIYVGNDTAWVATVNQTTDFLNQTLTKEELFFALPYDCLYYYLTGKESPTRQLIFFEHINIPPEQEKIIIAELEAKNVNTILLSNRFAAPMEAGLGFLGKTYCPLIAKYIDENFTPIARFGDWQNHPGWGWAHGTVVLKRK